MVTPNWSKEEDDIVKELYNHVPIEDLCKVLKSRTAGAIAKHAQSLGVSSVKPIIDIGYLESLRREIEG